MFTLKGLVKMLLYNEPHDKCASYRNNGALQSLTMCVLSSLDTATTTGQREACQAWSSVTKRKIGFVCEGKIIIMIYKCI